MLAIYSLHFFFFNDPAATEIYTLSLHDALPIYRLLLRICHGGSLKMRHHALGIRHRYDWFLRWTQVCRSEEHTSELQSLTNLVCRLLLEKKKKIKTENTIRAGKSWHNITAENIE